MLGLSEADLQEELRLRRLETFIPAMSPSYAAPVHLRPLLERFELACKGIPQRVVCHAPPRHAKTESVLHVPAFGLRRNPELRFSYSTYADRLSRSKSRRARQIAEAAGIALDSTALNEWRTPEGGGLLAGGVGGPLTGHGVDCVSTGTLISTPHGPRLVDEIWPGDTVWSFNHRLGVVEPRLVLATRAALRPTLILASAFGARLECTDEHRIFVGGSYKTACQIAAGDALLRVVPEGVPAPGLQCAQADEAWMRGCVLRASMQKSPSGDQEHQAMPDVRSTHGEQVKGADRQVLLQRMSSAKSEHGDVSGMRASIPQEIVAQGLLLSFMRQHGSLATNDGVRQFAFQGRDKLRERVRPSFDSGIEPRRQSMRDVRGETRNESDGLALQGDPEIEPRHPSPKRDSLGQPDAKPSDALSHLPRHPPQVETDSVAVVEGGSNSRLVFDIQVEGNENFFANGILVHNCLLIDDPVKNRLEAESSTYRERLVDWWRDVAATRIEPGGSAFIFMTRWHPDDLAGHLIGEGFDSILLPAIDDEGRPLWPERWPLEALEERRSEVGEFTWASLFQGAPRPRGGRVFGDVSTYAQLPASFRAAIGLDLAYSEATSADYSAAVRMARKGDLFYILDVMRKQEQAPRFKALCSAWNGRHPTDPWRWYAAGVERGAASFFREPPAIPLNIMAPLGDKFVRAISYAAAWNAGRVVLPERAPWLDAFVAEHAGFTGRNDKHDDQIDAAVAAFDQLNGGEADIPPRPPKVKATGLAAVDL